MKVASRTESKYSWLYTGVVCAFCTYRRTQVFSLLRHRIQLRWARNHEVHKESHQNKDALRAWPMFTRSSGIGKVLA